MKSAPLLVVRTTTLALGGMLLLLTRSLAETPEANVSAPLNSLTPEEQKVGWILLFDGKTTKGWRSFGKQEISPGWKVVDGALTRVSKGAGDLVTVDMYDSFEMSLEYNISRGGNSGVMFHVIEEGPYPWLTGPEVQIVDNKEGHDPQLSGWLYALYSSKVDATKPAGQWNRFRIIVSPRKSEVYHNGVKYYEFVKGSQDWNQRVAKSKFTKFPKFGEFTRGHIALQDHGAVVGFRNIKIRPLSER